MLGEVEAVLTRQVGRQGLPPPPGPLGDGPFGPGEGHEVAAQVRVGEDAGELVLPVVAPPRLGADEDVGVEGEDVRESPGRASPPVDAAVEVAGHHAHRASLRRAPRLWQAGRVDSVNVTFGHRLWWVDAFIGDQARGNPAVVVLLERAVSDADLQTIAFELGVSETAFVRRVGDGWSLRWFTPTVEVDLCGHATLATVHVLASELGVPAGELRFQTRAGVLSGRRLPDGMIGMDLPRAYLEPLDPSVLNGTLGPVREVFQAGAQGVLAIVQDYDELCGLAVDPVSLFLVPGSLIIAACAGGPDADVTIRVFAPRLGLAEDPVTGSAMCAVAPWWAARTGAPTAMVRQASARGGVMHSRLFESHVEVAGQARTFFGGDLRA